jgi:hypothetical protein
MRASVSCSTVPCTPACRRRLVKRAADSALTVCADSACCHWTMSNSSATEAIWYMLVACNFHLHSAPTAFGV